MAGNLESTYQMRVPDSLHHRYERLKLYHDLKERTFAKHMRACFEALIVNCEQHVQRNTPTPIASDGRNIVPSDGSVVIPIKLFFEDPDLAEAQGPAGETTI